MGSVAKDSLGKELVVRVEELEPTKAMELTCVLEEEDLVSLPTKFVNFSSYMRMPVVGFEKEICSLLKKLEVRKRCGVKV